MKNIFGGIAAFSLLIILVCLIRISPWGQANLPTDPMASGYVTGVGEVMAKAGAAVVEKKTDNVGFMGRIETDDVLSTPTPSQNEGFEHVMGKMERQPREPSEGTIYVMGSRQKPIIVQRPEQQMVYAPRRKEAPERPSFEQGYAPRPIITKDPNKDCAGRPKPFWWSWVPSSWPMAWNVKCCSEWMAQDREEFRTKTGSHAPSRHEDNFR